MNEGYKIYGIHREDFSGIHPKVPVSFQEIWRRLPGFSFRKLMRGGYAGWVSKSMNTEIYIPPSTIEAAERGASLFIAHGRRTGRKVEIFWVEPAMSPDVSEDDAVTRAKVFNEIQIARSRNKKNARRQRKATRQRKR